MTTQMIIRITSEKRRVLNRLSRAEGRTTSDVVRELIDSFINERDISGYIDGIWDRVGSAMKKKGITSRDIRGMIAAARTVAK